MEDTRRNWDRLPVEVCHKIFQLAVDTNTSNQSRHFTRVCKSWLIPAQAVLYSNVQMTTLEKLQEFYGIIVKAPHLGKKVKGFYLTIQTPANSDLGTIRELYNLFSNLIYTYLPNLEEIHNTTLRSYVPVLNALEDSRLMYLKRINSPLLHVEDQGELANYATCVVYMKDRIERVNIFEEAVASDKSVYQNPYYDRIYNRLNQLKNLIDLDLKLKTVSEVESLEYVLSNCQSLKTCTLEFEPPSKPTHFKIHTILFLFEKYQATNQSIMLKH